MSLSPFLSIPDSRYRDSFLEALQEFHAEGERLQLDAGAITEDFDGFVNSLLLRRNTYLPSHVPETVLWLIIDGEFVGRVSVRHELNADLLKHGGHIGYEIRPSMRRKGFGKLIATLGLKKAQELGIERVLITCDDTNIGSAKIIEAIGGILQDIIPVEGHKIAMRRYWIDN